ncbi:glyoxalase [Cupriavidus sp. USMAA2-4]|uniref:Glyoxalase n=1 Tax=Cupriavidus malaysiensis TaxID=367825 RepID=A0ABM6FAQ6_9BURK|nr:MULTISPECIES: VOC family protein [Cupriavidus]AOY95657.1 glyoxalase [Cupriavidus sp. USMAA2-4]AOZ01463.1 glyoxalase [Cupriavidus sp. USMAHM13]AOZ08806.1 glyoxalase [Cupriavidus malaysiensis]
MRPGLSFSHVGLYVRELAAMTRFYTELLEFTITDSGQLSGPHGPVELVFLSRDPDEHHQIVLATGRPEHIDFNVINQVSLRADSLATLKALYGRLAAAGATDIQPITHGNAVSVYARDPEGNRLELFVDTPWYVSQPMRVPLDFSLDDGVLMEVVEKHARALPGFEPRAAWRARMAAKMGVA